VTAQVVWVLGTLLLALVLLGSGVVSIDVVGMIVLGLTGLSGAVPPGALFSGFASEAVIVIAGMLALGEALVVTGVTQRLVAYAVRLGGSERRLALVLMLLAAIPSGFISDVGLVGVMMPVVLGLRRRLGVHPGRLLLPVAAAAMLGGLLTMVGSASTIVGNQVLGQGGHAPLGVFAITPIGLLFVVVGVAYTLAARTLVPVHESGARDWAEVVAKEYTAELRIDDASPLVGRAIAQVTAFADHDLSVVRLVRDGRGHRARPHMRLRAGDGLIVVGPGDGVTGLRDADLGVRLPADAAGGDDGGGKDPAAQAGSGERGRDDAAGEDEPLVAEAVVGPYSDLRGRTLAQTDLRRRTGVSVLAVLRRGTPHFDRLAHMRILAGDGLLLQGGETDLEALCSRRGLVLLAEPEPRTRPGSGMAVVAVGALAVALALAAAGFVPITLAVALAVTLVAAVGVLTPGQIYQAMDWRILVFVGGMLPLGRAMVATGITAHVAGYLLAVARAAGSNPHIVVALLFLVAAVLTQILSNVATVIVVAPVASALAHAAHVSPVPLIMTVVVAVAAAPLTPLASKVYLLVMGPGGYRYGDLARYGLPLTLVLGTLTVLAVPALFPLGG